MRVAAARRAASPPPAASVSRRTRAASGFWSSGSSSAAMARMAESKRSIWTGKASRKSPETRIVTSTRGRFSSIASITRKPVTRPDAASHTGIAPISARAWATSSPPVRMLAVPQSESAMARGQSPSSCT